MMNTQTQKRQLKSKSKDSIRFAELTIYENEARKNGFNIIAGIDEAGRGPLAGPVVAAACIIPEGLFFKGIDDSKKLSAQIRANLFKKITSHPQVHYGVGIVDHKTIDEINIYQATIRAMHLAVQALEIVPDHLLIDGLKVPGFSIPQTFIVKGDRLSQSIAAASIVAKETRDQIMRDYDTKFPGYGFKQHKGYATEYHRNAIRTLGFSEIHRLSFKVKELNGHDAVCAC